MLFYQHYYILLLLDVITITNLNLESEDILGKGVFKLKYRRLLNYFIQETYSIDFVPLVYFQLIA